MANPSSDAEKRTGAQPGASRARKPSRHPCGAARAPQGACRPAGRDRAPGGAGGAIRRRCRRFPPRPRRRSQAMTDLASLSARALAAAIRDRKVSSLEATKEAISRLAACHEADPLHRLPGGRRRPRCGPRRRRGRCPRGAGGAAGRRAARAQGHVRPRRQDRQLGRQHPRRQCRPAGRQRHRRPQEGRRAADRGPAPHRVRLRPHRPQLRAGPCPQPVGPDPHHRRLLGRHGLRRRLRRHPHGARLRHRRLAAPAGRVLRHRLHQADVGAREPRRRHAAGAGARHHRPHRPSRGGPCPRAWPPRRPGPARSGRLDAAGARLRRPPRRSGCRASG